MTAVQEDLFSHVPPLSRVSEVRSGWSHASAGQTETAAATQNVAGKAKQRTAVLRHIVDAGASGITRSEISDLFGIRLQSVTGRVAELLQASFVYVSGKRGGGGKLFATERGKRVAS